MSPATSPRWCPTPEQLMILEELYRSGVRTPTAPQIQRITAHLSLYGKIEGKNVFYWFQNHKARDRQKLRKKVIKQLQQQQQLVPCPCGVPQQQLITQQDQSNHHLHLNYFDPLFIPSPASSTSDFHHQFACHNYSPSFPPPQVGNEVADTTQITDHAWNVEIPPRITEDPNMMMGSMCCHDWMMMKMITKDVGPPLSPSRNATLTPTRPLETLELFPITATNLKEECNSSPRHLSCLTPTN